ncbi:MAG: hypothetical protein SPK97_05850 [Bacteroidales bacterium]|nr:hypothetical protein [Bacteroidales bacterium]
MRRWALYIVFLWTLGVAAAELTGVPCGATVRLRAIAPAGWHFDHWSDGSTDSVYLVEVHSDLHLIAYFSSACEDFSLPAVALYDRLIMLDMRSIQALGYFFEPDQATWYRVKGQPDPLDDSGDASSFDPPDEEVGTGYYLTLDQNLVGTGSYYALVDMSIDATGLLCPIMRSQLVQFSAPENAGSSAQKILRNNQIFILRGDKVYTLQGQEVK